MLRNMKSVYIGIFICIFFIYFGIILENALVSRISTSMKLNDGNKVSVMVKRQNTINYFTLSDIRFMKNKLKDEDIFTMSEAKAKVYFEGRDIDSKILGVSSNFNKFHNVNVSTGSFFTESIYKENEFCVVLEDKLAYKLFGNENVVGLKVRIFNKDFKIVGVVKRDSTIIQNISNDGLDKVYIPIETLIKLDETTKISYLQFQDLNNDAQVKGKDRVIGLLNGIGKNENLYKIIDYSKEERLMRQKPLILCFVLGGLCIWNFLKYLIKILREVKGFFITNIKKEYLLDVVIKNKKQFLIYILKLVLGFLGILVLWKLIKFNLYIPSNYIPDELINISYYKYIFQDSIKANIESREYLIPFIELKFMKANMLINILSIMVIFSGFILNTFVREFLNKSRDVILAVQCCGKCSIVALILTAIISMAFKMQFIIDLKILFIIWSFLFMRVIVQAKNTYFI